MTMTAAQFRATYSYLGFSLSELATELDISLNSARSWDKGSRPVPAGVQQELSQIVSETNQAIDYLAHHFDTHRAEWPMDIPRTAEDIPGMIPALNLSFSPTVGWWKHAGIRVCDRVPGLTLDWV